MPTLIIDASRMPGHAGGARALHIPRTTWQTHDMQVNLYTKSCLWITRNKQQPFRTTKSRPTAVFRSRATHMQIWIRRLAIGN